MCKIGESTQRNILFGTLIQLARVLQHGTTSLLLVNLKNIVFMNQNLEHVIVFIEDDQFALSIQVKKRSEI